MTRIKSALCAATLALLATPAMAAAPLAAYGELPSIEQMAISPNGQLLAIDVTKGEQRTIVVESLVQNKILTGLKVGEVKVRGLEWAGDGHLIITSSVTSGVQGVLADRGEWYTAADFNIRTQKLAPLLGDVDLSGNMLASLPQVRMVGGKPMVFATGMRFTMDEALSTLFKIDLDTDHSSIVMDSDGESAAGYSLGADGQPLALVQYDALSKSWGLKVWSSGGWRLAQARTAAIETPEVLGLGRDGHAILIGEREDTGYTLRELSPDGARLSDPLPGRTEGEPIHDPHDHHLLGVATLDGDDYVYNFFDPGDAAKWRAVVAAFPGLSVELESWSDDRSKVIVHIDSPTDGPGHVLVDMTAGTTRWLGADYIGLTAADIGPKTAIRFKAADGLELTGYLTLPNGAAAKSLPLVVFPHGGPAARDEPGFDWWAQAMASRGYAVLQVNYRGSDGFGWKFMSAGFGEWGQKMQTDLSDGVRYLASQGTIDPKRVCIVGASYGGYAAAAGATLDPGVYRCAVDVEGPVELGRFVAWAKDRESAREGIGTQRYWTRFMGANGLSDPHLAAISPVDQVAKTNIPMLVIHGKDDFVVPFEQGQMMVDAMRKAGKQVDFVILNHEDHWLSRGETRLQMLQATIDFLQKNNPPG